MVVKRSSEAIDAAVPPKEENFPRGGGGALTALERRQAREEGRSRAERDLSEGSRPSKKRKGSDAVEVQRMILLSLKVGVLFVRNAVQSKA